MRATHYCYCCPANPCCGIHISHQRIFYTCLHCKDNASTTGISTARCRNASHSNKRSVSGSFAGQGAPAHRHCTRGHYTTHHCAGINAFSVAKQSGLAKTRPAKGEGTMDRGQRIGHAHLHCLLRHGCAALCSDGGGTQANKQHAAARPSKQGMRQGGTARQANERRSAWDRQSPVVQQADRGSRGSRGGRQSGRVHAKPEQAEPEQSGPRDRAVQGGRE